MFKEKTQTNDQQQQFCKDIPFDKINAVEEEELGIFLLLLLR